MDVLLVEDEALIREVFCEHLSDEGFDVAEAPSGEDALALAQDDGAPQIVVTDVNLGPGMDGFSLATEVRKRWPDARVVVMTGNPLNLQDRPEGPQDRTLVKPVALDEMLSTVRELLGR